MRQLRALLPQSKRRHAVKMPVAPVADVSAVDPEAGVDPEAEVEDPEAEVDAGVADVVGAMTKKTVATKSASSRSTDVPR